MTATGGNREDGPQDAPPVLELPIDDQRPGHEQPERIIVRYYYEANEVWEKFGSVSLGMAIPLACAALVLPFNWYYGTMLLLIFGVLAGPPPTLLGLLTWIFLPRLEIGPTHLRELSLNRSAWREFDRAGIKQLSLGSGRLRIITREETYNLHTPRKARRLRQALIAYKWLESSR